MKRSTTLFLPFLLALALASCGTPAQYVQQYPDGIYLRPGEEPEVVRLYSEEDFERMAAANIARKQGRDTLVVILDDPWDYSWYSRYNHYYYSPWAWGGLGLGFSSYYWNRWRFGYDPWFYDPWYYDPWYYGYGYSYGWYDPWYYDPWYGGYGWYGHRYGWYDQPWYYGGGWGGGRNYANRVYTPRSTTTVGGSRERRPGSGSNYRYGGTAGSAGSSVIRGGNTRSVNRSQAGTVRSGSSSSSSSTTRSREQGYNPARTYGNSGSSSNSGSRSSSRSYSSESGRSYGSGSYSSGSSTRSYSGSSSSGSSRSYGGGGGGGYSGGGGGGSSRSSGGGGSHSSGGRR